MPDDNRRERSKKINIVLKNIKIKINIILEIEWEQLGLQLQTLVKMR